MSLLINVFVLVQRPPFVWAEEFELEMVHWTLRFNCWHSCFESWDPGFESLPEAGSEGCHHWNSSAVYSYIWRQGKWITGKKVNSIKVTKVAASVAYNSVFYIVPPLWIFSLQRSKKLGSLAQCEESTGPPQALSPYSNCFIVIALIMVSCEIMSK